MSNCPPQNRIHEILKLSMFMAITGISALVMLLMGYGNASLTFMPVAFLIGLISGSITRMPVGWTALVGYTMSIPDTYELFLVALANPYLLSFGFPYFLISIIFLILVSMTSTTLGVLVGSLVYILVECIYRKYVKSRVVEV